MGSVTGAKEKFGAFCPTALNKVNVTLLLDFPVIH